MSLLPNGFDYQQGTFAGYEMQEYLLLILSPLSGIPLSQRFAIGKTDDSAHALLLTPALQLEGSLDFV
nr:hypothetical protein [Nostoc sp. EkiNYC01]